MMEWSARVVDTFNSLNTRFQQKIKKYLYISTKPLITRVKFPGPPGIIFLFNVIIILLNSR